MPHVAGTISEVLFENLASKSHIDGNMKEKNYINKPETLVQRKHNINSVMKEIGSEAFEGIMLQDSKELMCVKLKMTAI